MYQKSPPPHPRAILSPPPPPPLPAPQQAPSLIFVIESPFHGKNFKLLDEVFDQLHV
jgi:hypothetical protein